MKKIFFLVVISILLTGCTAYNDISNIAVVNTIGIEKNDKYKIFVKISASNQENEEKIYTEECKILKECFNNLNTQLMKRLYLTHLDLLILSQNLEKSSYDDIFNFFLSEKTSRNSFTTIITNTIDEKILSYDGKDIINMLSLSIKTNGLVKNISLDQIIKDVLNFETSYIPYLELNDKLEVKGYKEIYQNEKILSKEESISINIIRNFIDEFNIILNRDLYKLEECNTTNKVNNNNVSINFSCKVQAQNTEDLENYLNKEINDFIENNNKNYLSYLVYKFNGKELSNINYKIDIKLKKKESSGGEIFE